MVDKCYLRCFDLLFHLELYNSQMLISSSISDLSRFRHPAYNVPSLSIVNIQHYLIVRRAFPALACLASSPLLRLLATSAMPLAQSQPNHPARSTPTPGLSSEPALTSIANAHAARLDQHCSPRL